MVNGFRIKSGMSKEILFCRFLKSTLR